MEQSVNGHEIENVGPFGLQVIRLLWKRRRILLLASIVSLGAGLILAFTWPKVYKATATVFPVTANSSSALSQYAGLAGLAGIDIPIGGNGGSDPNRTVNALLGSRILVERLVTELNLVEVLPLPFREDKALSAEEVFQKTVEWVAKKLTYSVDKQTGVVAVSLELADPVLAAEATNRILKLLDRLLLEKSMTTARKKAESLEGQISAQRAKVEQYQRDMARFQEDTELLDPKSQAGRAIEAYTKLVQQRMELELELATAQGSYAQGNPRISILRRQIDSLISQIQGLKTEVDGDLPSLKAAPENLIKYQNLSRDLEIGTTLYAGLLASYEQLKIEGDQDQVYLEVLDRALVPTLGSPSRLLVLLLAFALGVLGSTSLLFIVELVPEREFWMRVLSAKGGTKNAPRDD